MYGGLAKSLTGSFPRSHSLDGEKRAQEGALETQESLMSHFSYLLLSACSKRLLSKQRFMTKQNETPDAS